ncbi:MAG TPA: ATP-binding protein, partial [Terriglobales bacterium]|nr:ATP-binding protein [Terriglobales bacterium]
VVNETVKRYGKSLHDKGLSLNVELAEGELSVVSDRAKIERIFQNIFNNAVKFTVQGDITVKAQRSADRNSVEFEISDTGTGIEESKIDSIFEPFHQADNSIQRAFSGLGLGLTVARRMTELIGGKLEVSSKPNVGTRVTMTFPTHASMAAPFAVDQRKYG